MREAVRFVLRDSHWSGINDFAELMEQYGESLYRFEKAFERRYGDEDFQWPWFDEWRQRFAELGQYPRSWDYLDPSGQGDSGAGRITIDDALGTIPKAGLLAIARSLSIQIRPSEKVGAIRRTLANKLPQAAADVLIRKLEEEMEASYEKAFRRRKRILLYRSVIGVNYAMFRAAQLADAGFRYYVFKHDEVDSCPIHKCLDGITLPAEHPFWKHVMLPTYPGDACCLYGANTLECAKHVGGTLASKLPDDWESLLALGGQRPGGALTPKAACASDP